MSRRCPIWRYLNMCFLFWRSTDFFLLVKSLKWKTCTVLFTLFVWIHNIVSLFIIFLLVLTGLPMTAKDLAESYITQVCVYYFSILFQFQKMHLMLFSCKTEHSNANNKVIETAYQHAVKEKVKIFQTFLKQFPLTVLHRFKCYYYRLAYWSCTVILAEKSWRMENIGESC